MAMELYQLKSFITIAREKNLTRAAELLHLSQSALSSQIKALEESLGVVLFRRSSRGMQLSQPGQTMLRHAEEILECAGRMSREADLLSRGTGTSLTIGLNADPTFLRVSAINQRLSSLHDNINAIFLTSQSVDTAQMLRRGMIDLGLFYGEIPDSDIAVAPLSNIRFCLVIPKHLYQPENLKDWQDISRLPWIWVGNNCPPYVVPKSHFDKLRVTPNQSTLAVDERIVRELVVAGQGVAMMREDEARLLADAGQVGIWEKGWHSLPLNLGWLSDRAKDKTIAAARDAIHYIWQEGSFSNPDSLTDKYWA